MGAIPFSSQNVANHKYWYERSWYTAGPIPSVPAGVLPIAGAQLPENKDKLMILSALESGQSPYVQVGWQYDRNQANQGGNSGYTDAARAGVRYMSVSAPALTTLNLTMQNVTGASVTNFQLNYAVAVQQLTVADKLLRELPLTDQDKRVLDALPGGLKDLSALVEKGILPHPIEVQMENMFLSHRLGDHPQSGMYHVNVGSNTTGVNWLSIHATTGEWLALEELAIEGAPAVNVYVDRDDNTNYAAVTGAAFASSDDRPWDFFVPALRYINLRADASSTINGVPIRVRVGRYRMSNVLRVRFGLATQPSDVPGDTWAKVLAGLA